MLQQIFFFCVCVKMIVLDTYEHVKQISLKVILCGAYLFASLCHITLRTTPTGGRGFQIMTLYALIITCSGFNSCLLCFRCRSTVSDGGERRLVPALPLPAPGHGPLWPEGGGRLVLQSLPLVLPAGPWAESDRRPATRSRYTSGQLLLQTMSYDETDRTESPIILCGTDVSASIKDAQLLL